MARLSDAEWMRRFVARVGSQRAAAQRLGVSASMVGRVAKGQRSGARYRDAAKAGAQGKPVSPPAPTRRTPRRVRKPARVPDGGGGSRVMTKSARLLGHEVSRTLSSGRTVQSFTATIRAQRADQYRHKSDGGWSGALTLDGLTEHQLELLQRGDLDAIADAFRDQNSWLGEVQFDGFTFRD